MDRPYAVIPQGKEGVEGEEEELLVNISQWTGFRAGWLESQTEQLQRVGKLMHSIIDGAEYHLLMSPDELQKYERRLYGLYSRQFKLNILKH